ncbi:phytanoyl-CoA dioxygenase family protein [Streptomyces profundus]|uniref:phytanoyl-CoA dioxygenase family protein n=1 Tax=Streptomyces profundus TaxID=2867410 RepID=UPI001D16CE22|nr:phytanoyl-CoA dioxygenase family protein [Streptomyces sp. MA3_2.13]UED88012.1 phytanoyl-CoA dioxygenase family protein [Streptomyces sp. MA3_2.13]
MRDDALMATRGDQRSAGENMQQQAGGTEGQIRSASERDWTPLSDADLRAYQTDGYLHLRGLFDPAEVARGQQLVKDARESGTPTIAEHESFTDRRHTVRVRDAIAHHPGLAEFLDHPGLIGPLASVLGPSVQVLGTEIFIRGLHDSPLESWHTDGGEYLQRIRLEEASVSLQVKAQVFLSDTSEDDCGNFLLIPGSHRRIPRKTVPNCYIEELNDPFERGEMPSDAVTVHAAPGDVLLFPYSLWHAVAKNTRRPRETFIFRFGHLWHRPHDYLQQPPEVLDTMSARLRRMFGDFGDDPHPTDFYKPPQQRQAMTLGAAAGSR